MDLENPFTKFFTKGKTDTTLRWGGSMEKSLLKQECQTAHYKYKAESFGGGVRDNHSSISLILQ